MSGSVRQLAEGLDVESPAVDVLARAFRDNPLDVAVLGPSARRRLRSNRAGMRASLVASRGIALRLVAQADGRAPEGVLLATPPGRHPLPEPPMAEQLRCLFLQGPRAISRWGLVGERLQGLHSVEQHWYLGLLGVDPDRQGRGVGSRLMEAFIARVDSDAVPAYLETDRIENTHFYARFGFELSDELEIFDVTVFTMRRTVV